MSRTKISFRNSVSRNMLTLCAGLALAMFTPLARHADAQDGRVAARQTTRTKPSTPQEVWTAVVPRIDVALRESNNAIAARIATLDEFFAERQQGARPFAEAVLSLEGKARATAGIGEELVGGLGQLLGQKRPSGPNSFVVYVRDRFRTKVLDPAELKTVVDEAVAGYVGDATEIEGRLLVDLKADIDDRALDLRLQLPALRVETAAGASCDAVIGETLDAAAKDLGVALGMFVASNYIGDKVAQRVTPKDASKARKALVNILVGIGVDQAMDRAARQAGYDPEKELTARTSAGIDRIRSLVVEGDPQAVGTFVSLFKFREAHPDPAAREACREAMDALERSSNLGLRVRLITLHNERHRQLATALAGHVFGREAVRTPLRLLPALDAGKAPTSESVVRWAKSITNVYGGTR